MMKTVLLVVVCLTYIRVSHAQTCYPGGLVLSTQQQIDQFASNNPGCTQILGDLCIGLCTGPNNDSAIENLNGLSQIISVAGDLSITWNPEITDLQGLENLTSVGGDLRIMYSDGYNSLNGLDGLTRVEGSLVIFELINLESISGLDNLQYVGGDLTIFATDLEDLNG